MHGPLHLECRASTPLTFGVWRLRTATEVDADALAAAILPKRVTRTRYTLRRLAARPQTLALVLGNALAVMLDGLGGEYAAVLVFQIATQLL